MNEIGCGICMDLAPLVRDGIAGPESTAAVQRHLRTCPACRAAYDGGEAPPAGDVSAFLQRFRLQLRLLAALALVLGAFAGLSLTGGSGLFYNIVLMPVLGALGFAVLGLQAVWAVPTLLLGLHLLTNTLSLLRGAEHFTLPELALWTAIYSAFALLGVTIAALARYAARLWRCKAAGRGIGALAAALVLVGGLCWLANGTVGNPVSRALAGCTARRYVARQYAGTDYRIDSVVFSFKDGMYHAQVTSPTSIDTHFSLVLGMDGSLRQDYYEAAVLSGENTARRLDAAYRAMVDAVLEAPDFPFATDMGYGELLFRYGDEPYSSDDPADPYRYALDTAALERDKDYDIPALAAEAGHLVVYGESDTITAAAAAQQLLQLRQRMDEAGVPFRTVYYALVHPRGEDGQRDWDDNLYLLQFAYEDIIPDGLTDRVQAAADEAAAYYAAEDAKQAAGQGEARAE